MSASNWAICPRCLKRAHGKADAALAAVLESYGKVPVADFDARRSALAVVRAEDFRTFREDYDICGADEGAVTVSYSGGCAQCGLSLDFKDERALPL